ncbi:NAD-dependent epimerase/dehydratase family protein [Promicromonospora iranensis]|uniref:NAD(P)-dependent dehydrogenase (Short-subunit alcohol dehydrogenase family) n=1 Tax=Promicromonospora iranensis TaxID=1105144 RepID=A0ABU2CLZ4_9MICO|nr:NAD(P)-dependent oxidoreductase [Promicromonospora iranensis]MDR7382333.1 NAD(P)-dependent dehydrogenase (short-subunit alcohol dehydrogenase family) [Promicromonospora iranensis]
MARIVITGSSGRMAADLRPRLLAAGHCLVLVDVVPTAATSGEEHHAVSVTDVDALVPLLHGADLVVHLAGYSRERPWADIAEVNIGGGYGVLEAAYRAGVRRLLMASSLHAAGCTPVGEADRLPVLLPRPDGLYGAGKVAVEALASAYADRCAMVVVSARVMNYATRPERLRTLSLWLSPDDFARLVEAALRLDRPGHHIVWGVSRNTRGVVSLAAGHAIGFYPCDDAEDHAHEIVPADGDPVHDRLGGAFLDDAHPMGVAW